MIKKSLLILFFLAFVSNPPLYAEPKTFSLKDGSVIKGEVLELNNGVYTVQMENANQLTIPDTDIVSMTSGEAPLIPTPSQNSDPALVSQVNQLQSDILADPDMLKELETLMKDPEIMGILTDQNFMNDVLSYDPNRIETNQKTQELLGKPAIQTLIQKINQKLPAQQAPTPSSEPAK